MSKWKRVAALAGWVLVIGLLTLTPQPPAPPGAVQPIPFFDKLGHFALFFIFSLLAFRLREERSLRNYLLLTVWAAAYMVFIEYAQLFVPGREFELMDVAAGLAGAGGFFLLLPHLERFLLER